jgi:hypothetical protein
MGNSLSIPVAVLLEKKIVQGKGWSVPEWNLVGVLGGEHSVGDVSEPVLVRDDDDQYLWGGYRLNLYLDSCESYWHNLTGEQPSLFVICTEAGDGGMQPLIVTADGLEASASTEGDDRVFRAPIPPEIYLRIEKFVVDHYVPRERKKRKRQNWTEGDRS